MNAPVIPPVASGPRPLWSVMLPVYRPDPHYLAQTLESVLQQAPGPEQMQIAIVDDASEEATARLAAEAANGRIEFYQQAKNAGMARNWNHAVTLARGRWVHLLHQDDLVLPGFYRKLQTAIEANPEIGAAYTQHYLIDGRGRPKCVMSLNPAKEPGVVQDWLRYVFIQLSFQTPAVVVRRDVYEQLGGFREDFRYALDWDMWKRLAAQYPIWFEPEALACYRRHASGASMGFFATGENFAEVRRSIEVSREYLPAAQRDRMEAAANAHYRRDAVDNAISALFTVRDPSMALSQFKQARMFGGGGFSSLVVQRFFAAVSRAVRYDMLGRPKPDGLPAALKSR